MAWTINPTAAAPYETRRRVRELLGRWGLHEDHVDVVLLVANELVSNAVDHAQGAVTILVTRAADLVTVAVTDGSDSPPLIQPVDTRAPRGRGLQIVDALAQRWNWTSGPNGRGKTVWAEILGGADTVSS